MLGHIKKKKRKQKPGKSRLLSSTKGEENTVEFRDKSKTMEIKTSEIEECLYLEDFFQIFRPSQKTWTLIGLTFGLIRDHYRNIFCRWTHHRRSTQNFFSFGSSVFVGALICMNKTHIVWGSGLIIGL